MSFTTLSFIIKFQPFGSSNAVFVYDMDPDGAISSTSNLAQS